MNESGHSPGVRDVADVAGVSRQTVSRVLNEHPSIRPETRDRVRAAMVALNFRPNRAARMLTTAKSRTIGVLAAHAPSLFGPASSIDALERAARAQGYFVTVAHTPSLDRESLEAALDHLLAQAVEGVVVVAPQHRAQQALAAVAVGIPFVTLHDDAPAGIDGSYAEQMAGARLATRHLVDRGHRRILHVCGPQDWAEARARREGFCAEAQSAGIEAIVSPAGDWSARSGADIAEKLLVATGVTAVFSSNDQMALGVLHRARALGRRVPDDLAVVGFDDVPEAAYFSPPLTTIRQDFAELGRLAVGRLLDSLGGASPSPGPQSVQHQPAARLMIREST